MNRDIDILTTMRLQGMPAVDIEYVRRAFAERATPAPVAQKVPDDVDNTEGWELLAISLCEDDGYEPHELLYSNDPMPEPWGERWLKYEHEAKYMIAKVQKYAARQSASARDVVRDAAELNHLGQYWVKRRDQDDDHLRVMTCSTVSRMISFGWPGHSEYTFLKGDDFPGPLLIQPVKPPVWQDTSDMLDAAQSQEVKP